MILLMIKIKTKEMKTFKTIIALFALIAFSISANAQFQLIKDYDEASAGYLEISYRQDVAGNVQAHSKGFGLEFGFNVGKFMNEKMNLNPYGGIGFGWGAKTKNDFLLDFNRYGENTEDAIIDNFRKSGYSGEDGGKSVNFTYGILFRAPSKYSPILTLYGKSQMTSVKHANSIYVNESGSDVGIWRSGRGVGLRIPVNGNLYFGVYYDSYNLRKAKTQKNPGTRIEDAVSEEFFDKNGKRENVVGFRIGANTMVFR